MIYKLPGGSRVRTVAHGDATEFITSNPQGEVISTVRQRGVDAEITRSALLMADSIRFAQVYGGGRVR